MLKRKSNINKRERIEWNHKNVSEEIRAVLKEEKKKQAKDEYQKQLQSRNLIFHGVQEGDNEVSDEQFIGEFMEEIGVNISAENIYRIGKKSKPKVRPLKLTLNCEDEKKIIFKNIHKLQGKTRFDKIKVTEDFTPEERQTMRHWYEKAKERNKIMKNAAFIWQVPGNPKTHLRLKRIPKPKPLESFTENENNL